MPALSVVGHDLGVMQSFQSFLTSELPVCEMDLSNASLVQVLFAHDSSIARKNGGKHRNRDLISWIQKLEEEFDITISPMKVTADFYNFAIQRMVEEGKRLSTINQYLSKLKNALNWSKKFGGRVSSTFDEFAQLKYTNDLPALTPDEVSHIAHFRFDLYLDEHGKNLRRDTIRTLSAVRDMFVLQCNIGQRFSDMHVLSQNNFDDTLTRYRVTQQKTGNIAEVDLKHMTIDSHRTFSILRSHNFQNPLPKMEINRFNKLLHRIMHMIGGDFLREIIICTYKIAGKIHEIRLPLWKAISTHTARRTYITTMVNLGKPYTAIRRCSGHKSLKAFEGYIRGSHFED